MTYAAMSKKSWRPLGERGENCWGHWFWPGPYLAKFSLNFYEINLFYEVVYGILDGHEYAIFIFCGEF